MNLYQIFLIIVLALYVSSLVFILLYSITQGYLAFVYLKLSKKEIPEERTQEHWPSVTLQLPVYNERYVVGRLLDAVAAIDYPKDKLQIQLLDDSTDETTAIASDIISNWGRKGVEIEHLRRSNRTGYKAGALKNGMCSARGEFIAIFDADFEPKRDFLKQTIVAFQSPDIGMVQTRWTHLNRNHSLLTRAQAFTIDAHFLIEQTGRHGTGSFINFNGTAGVWRKQCILDAGNWHADTLTEDLDLSYRAQIKGWRFIYLKHTTAPAELPPVISAVKSQQYRWNKGGAETAKKLWLTLLRARLPLHVKWFGSFHLLSSSVFIAVFISAVCSIPVLQFKQAFPQYRAMYNCLSIFLISFLVVAWIYYLVVKHQHGPNKPIWKIFLKEFPLFLSFSMGLSLHNAIAVIEGYAGRKTPFVRTPKFNIHTTTNVYLRQHINLLSIMEAIMTLYFAYGIFYAFQLRDFTMLPFHVMLTLGFGMVTYYTFFDATFKARDVDNAG